MKKLILAVSLIVVLIGSIAGGIAYAIDNGHQPNLGNKLVGIVAIGYDEDPLKGNFEFGANCGITNPDCLKSITITRVALLYSSGDVLWEGSPGDFPDQPQPDILGPHQSMGFALGPELVQVDGDPVLDQVTIEVAWEAKKGTCPLMGAVSQYIGWVVDDKLEELVFSATPMVNFVQKR